MVLYYHQFYLFGLYITQYLLRSIVRVNERDHRNNMISCVKPLPLIVCYEYQEYLEAE